MGTNTWCPDVFHIGESVDVYTRIDPQDYKLSLMLGASAGVEGIKCKDRPSLANVVGLHRVRQLRNKAQAEQMNPSVNDKKGMFDDDG